MGGGCGSFPRARRSSREPGAAWLASNTAVACSQLNGAASSPLTEEAAERCTRRVTGRRRRLGGVSIRSAPMGWRRHRAKAPTGRAGPGICDHAEPLQPIASCRCVCSSRIALRIQRIIDRSARLGGVQAKRFFRLGGIQQNCAHPQLEEGVVRHGVLPNQQMLPAACGRAAYSGSVGTIQPATRPLPVAAARRGPTGSSLCSGAELAEAAGALARWRGLPMGRVETLADFIGMRGLT